MLPALLLAIAAPLALAAVDVRDDHGHTLHLEQPPQRVVSLLPSLTETVCALDQCHRLVGVDRYSNWPARVRGLPQLGGGLDPSVEAVVALKPDLVLVATSSQSAQRLRDLGLKVAAFEPGTHAELRRTLHAVGQLLGVDGAERLWQRLDAGVAAAARGLPGGVAGARVYVEVSPGPYGAGPRSFIGETLQRLGLGNILPPELGPFPKLNPEFIVRADPDLIMAGSQAVAGMAQRPGWGTLRALRERRVCAFTHEQADLLVRPGPRLDEAARLMVACVADKAARSRP